MKNPKEECEELLNSAMPFAELMLKQHGEFYRFGKAMTPNGKSVAVGGACPATNIRHHRM
jgi:hypothetical protein